MNEEEFKIENPIVVNQTPILGEDIELLEKNGWKYPSISLLVNIYDVLKVFIRVVTFRCAKIIESPDET